MENQQWKPNTAVEPKNLRTIKNDNTQVIEHYRRDKDFDVATFTFLLYDLTVCTNGIVTIINVFETTSTFVKKKKKMDLLNKDLTLYNLQVHHM